MSRCRKERGFTLLELLFGLVIMTILAVTAIVSVNLGGRDIDGVAKVLRSNLQFAQDLAMTHGSLYGFQATSGNAYQIYDGAPGTPAQDPLTGGSMNVNISPTSFFGGAQPLIRFLSTGQPDIVVLGSDRFIKITDGTRQRYIEVEANTGFVRITNSP